MSIMGAYVEVNGVYGKYTVDMQYITTTRYEKKDLFQFDRKRAEKAILKIIRQRNVPGGINMEKAIEAFKVFCLECEQVQHNTMNFTSGQMMVTMAPRWSHKQPEIVEESFAVLSSKHPAWWGTVCDKMTDELGFRFEPWKGGSDVFLSAYYSC